MSKYRIHRITEDDKKLVEALDRQDYDISDQAVYCLTDKKGNVYFNENTGCVPVYISSYNKDVKGLPNNVMQNLEAQVYFTRVIANSDNINVKQYNFGDLANKNFGKKKAKIGTDTYRVSVIDMNEDNRLIWASQSEAVKQVFEQFSEFVHDWYAEAYGVMADVIEEKVNDYRAHQNEYDEDAEYSYEDDEEEYDEDEEYDDDDEEYEEDEEEYDY